MYCIACTQDAGGGAADARPPSHRGPGQGDRDQQLPQRGAATVQVPAAAADAAVAVVMLLLLQSAGAEAGGEPGHLQPGHGAALRGLQGDQAGGQRLPHPVP